MKIFVSKILKSSIECKFHFVSFCLKKSYSLTTVPSSFSCICILELKCFDLLLILFNISHISEYHNQFSLVIPFIYFEGFR